MFVHHAEKVGFMRDHKFYLHVEKKKTTHTQNIVSEPELTCKDVKPL